MFIRLKTGDGEVNVAVAQIQMFTPAGVDNKGSEVTLVDGDAFVVTESNRVIRKLISEAGSPATEAE